ncbi:MAG: caspase family protein [Vulcanibacillus sp.]
MVRFYLTLIKTKNILLLFFAFLIFSLPIFSQELTLETAVQVGHTKGLQNINFSPDGNYILTTGENAKLWDAVTATEIRTFRGNSDFGINSVCFTSDSKSILIQDTYKTAKLYDLITGNILSSFEGENGKCKIKSIHIISENNMVMIVFSDSVIYFDLSGTIIKTVKLNVDTFVEHSSLSTDSRYLVTTHFREFKLWDPNTGKDLIKVRDEDSFITSINFSPDGRYILTGKYDNKSKLWDIKTGELLKIFEGNAPTFSPNNKYIATIDNDTTKLWNVDTGKLIRFCTGHTSRIISVKFSPNSKYLVTGSFDKTAILCEVETGKQLQIFKGKVNRVKDMHFTANKEHLALINNNLIQYFDFNACKVEKDFLIDNEQIDFSPDGKYILAGSQDRTAKLYDAETGKLLQIFKGHNGFVASVAFNPDAKYFATGSGQYDGKVRLWNINSGKEVNASEGFEFGVSSIDFSPDGKLYVTSEGGNHEVKIWDTNTSSLIKTLINYDGSGINPEYIHHAYFNSDGKYIVVVGINEVSIYDPLKNSKIYTFKESNYPISDAIMNKDNNILFTGSIYGEIKLWDIKSGKLLKTTQGHSSIINSMIIHPNGKYLISASEDGTTKLWDISSGEELATLISIGENDWVVTTPDGFFDASEGGKNSVHFVKGLEVYELDQFFEEFYRPGLLAEVTSGEKSNRPDITIEDKLLESPPPNVEIISPQIDQKFTNQTIKVEIKAINTGGGIDEVKLLHNGKRVAGESRGIKIKSTNKEIYETFNISLVKGDNELIASAFSKGRIESKGYKINISYNGPSKIATSYILAIGINEYKNKQLNLNYAKSDAEAFVKIVSSKSHNLFDKIEIITLYDIEANMTNILNALDDIAQKAKPEDVFTFFYAGHGSVIDNRYYIVTSENIKLYDREKLDKNALYIKMLQDKLSDIKALKQLVVMDACQSGAATEMLALRGAAEEKALAQLGRSAGVHVFASSGSDQFASEFNELKHGVFTYVLLEALQGKADGSPKDGKVTINELKSYIEDQVPIQSEKYKGESQYPTTASKGQDFPVILIK